MNRKRAVTRKLPLKIITYARNPLGPVLQKLLYFYSRTFPPRLISTSIILTTDPAPVLLLNFAAISKWSGNEAKRKNYENNGGDQGKAGRSKRWNDEQTTFSTRRQFTRIITHKPRNFCRMKKYFSGSPTIFLNAFRELREWAVRSRQSTLSPESREIGGRTALLIQRESSYANVLRNIRHEISTVRLQRFKFLHVPSRPLAQIVCIQFVKLKTLQISTKAAQLPRRR